MAEISDYTDLITSEHADKPKFIAMVSAVAGAFVASQNFLESMPTAFDLDTAAGAQLDVLGLWIGIARRIATPVSNVYFTWDVSGVGWDQGIWKSPADPSSTVSVLDDETYRLVLRAKIGANSWDGTVATAGPLLSAIFGPNGAQAKINDHGNMAFDVLVTGPRPSKLGLAMLTGGYIPIKPAGVSSTFLLSLQLDGSWNLDGTQTLDGLT